VKTSSGLIQVHRDPDMMSMPDIRSELKKRGLVYKGNRHDIESRLVQARAKESMGREASREAGASGVYEPDRFYLRPYQQRITESDLQPYPNQNAYALCLDKNDPRLAIMCSALSIDPDVSLRRPCACTGCALKQLRVLNPGRISDAIPPTKFSNPIRAGDRNLYLESTPDRLITDTRVQESRIRKFRISREAQMKEWAARRLQSAWRCVVQRRKFQTHFRLHVAAIVIGRYFRGYLGKKRLRKKRFQDTMAAITIQKVIQGKFGRNRYCLRMGRHVRAAVLLQKAWRGKQGRLKWEARRRVMTSVAVVFQSIGRGHSARLMARRKKETYDWAIRRIQPIVRGKLKCTGGRLWFNYWHGKRMKAASDIQRAYRAYVTRNWMPRMAAKRNRAATLIQKISRGWLVRHRKKKRAIWQAKKTAALRIQPWFRHQQARKRRVKAMQLLSVVYLQARFRAYLARRMFKRLKFVKAHTNYQII